MRFQSSCAIVALGLCFRITSSQSLPYNPTTILISSSSSNIAYVFLQSPDSDTTNQLLSLNISSTLSSTNLTLETVTQYLPFQTDGSTAFVPSISTSGEISVYAGSCSTATSARLWRFLPDSTDIIRNGTWTSPSTVTADDITSADMPGADFLARSFSFSTLVHANSSDTQLYVFGGMCPTSGATTSSWQSAASYSNNMLRLSPESSSYTLEIPLSRGSPIAEAGFTITGLTPTYSNGSAITQQQNFILLGGHTQSAFINMSQVAIWSLPEEVWSFVSVDLPSSNANTELAIKSIATNVDSRSGHTAVLIQDGSQMIVFGGWVGDTSQAAQPQLAILELGSGFGGNGDWSWSIPTQQPGGPGIYGHGAVMLPGDVMMVLGGYNISNSINARRDSTSGSTPMFLNVTTMSWISDYTNPNYIATAANIAAHTSSSEKSNGKKLGLGVGLGLGLAILLIIALTLLWYKRRRMHRRVVEREKHIQSLSAGHSFYSPTREVGHRSGMFPWVNNGWNRNDNGKDGNHDSTISVAGYENLHAGVHGLGDNGIPPVPRHIQRKPLHSRNARGIYQPAAGFEINPSGNHGRSNSLGTAGPIHPIYEADEDDHISHGPHSDVGVALGDPNSAPSTANPNRHSDPFRDPPINFSAPRRPESRKGSPDTESSAHSREREIQEWVSDWAAADALLNTQARSHSSAGRVSPTRRAQLIAASNVSSISVEDDGGRTESNLSEKSIAISAMTISRSGSSSLGTRSNSLRGFLSNAINPFTSSLLSVTGSNSALSPAFDRNAKGEPPRSAGSSGGSFTTAHSSFPALQAEGESLLPRPDEGLSRDYSPSRHSPDHGSPSKSKQTGLGKGRSGWLGSIRKAIVGDGISEQNSPEGSSFGNRTPSPTRAVESAMLEPRRTVSAGAMLWRRKQGRGDWDDSEEPDERNRFRAQRSSTFTGDIHSMTSGNHTQDLEDEEWDIERAVQNRVVQVMFTVPKEKLRVVNHDVDEDMSDVGSLRSKKGSNKSLKALEPMLPVDESTQERELTNEPLGKGEGKELSKVQELVQRLERAASPERV